MASHHHNHGGCRRHHHNYREIIPPEPFNYATSPPCCCADSSPCCNQSNNHPSPPNLDHLVRLIASYLQNQQQTQRFNAEYDNLLRKVDHLDLSLSRFAACHDDKRRVSYHSKLKDSAARVIQTHFRSYLVHRSISLRQLKELATLKSNFLSLRSSVSAKTHFPFQAVSRQATDLLHRLDSIQGRVDSMIRDGKRSLRRDVVRFLHYIDDFAAKRRHIVCKSAKDVSFTGQERRFVSKRHVGEERIPEKLRRKMGTTYGDIAELQEFHFTSDDAQHVPLVSVKKTRKVGSLKSRVGELVKGDKVKKPVTKTVMFGKNRSVYELTSSVEDDSFDDGEEILMISRDDGVGSNSRSGSRSGVVTKGSGVKTRVMKTVSFDENGNVYKVYGDTPETSVTEGDDDSTSGSNNSNGDPYNEVEDIKYVPKENEGLKESEEEEEEEEEETLSENEEEPSSEGSKEEEQVIENVSHPKNQEHKREFQPRKGSSMFSPPLPLKMES